MENKKKLKKGTIGLFKNNILKIKIEGQDKENLIITNKIKLKIHKKNSNLIHLLFPKKTLNFIIASEEEKQLLIKFIKKITDTNETKIEEPSNIQRDQSFEENMFLQDTDQLETETDNDEDENKFRDFYLSDGNGNKIEKCEIQINAKLGIIKITNSQKKVMVYTIKSNLIIYEHPTIECLSRFVFKIIKQKIFLLSPTKELRKELIHSIIPLINSKKERFLVQMKNLQETKYDFTRTLITFFKNFIQIAEFNNNEIMINKFDYTDLTLKKNAKNQNMISLSNAKTNLWLLFKIESEKIFFIKLFTQKQKFMKQKSFEKLDFFQKIQKRDKIQKFNLDDEFENAKKMSTKIVRASFSLLMKNVPVIIQFGKTRWSLQTATNKHYPIPYSTTIKIFVLNKNSKVCKIEIDQKTFLILKFKQKSLLNEFKQLIHEKHK